MMRPGSCSTEAPDDGLSFYEARISVCSGWGRALLRLNGLLLPFGRRADWILQ